MQEERRGRRPRPVRLTARERKQLLVIAGQYGRPYREVLRARILLVLERDPCVSAAARRLEVDVKTVRRWRDRFVEKRHKEALRDKPRSGRPPQIGLLSRCELLSMACGRPSDFGERTRDVWTIDSLLVRFRRRRSRPSMSRTSVIRILSEAEIRPHRVRMWLHSPDPEFRPKVKRICRLYLRPPRDGVVLCIDEKSGMQALGRKHDLRLASRGRSGRHDCEYVRHGTRTLFAAFNPHTGDVYSEVRKRRKTVDILDFMEAVARRYPRKKIYVIWDNLNVMANTNDGTNSIGVTVIGFASFTLLFTRPGSTKSRYSSALFKNACSDTACSTPPVSWKVLCADSFAIGTTTKLIPSAGHSRDTRYNQLPLLRSAPASAASLRVWTSNLPPRIFNAP